MHGGQHGNNRLQWKLEPVLSAGSRSLDGLPGSVGRVHEKEDRVKEQDLLVSKLTDNLGNL